MTDTQSTVAYGYNAVGNRLMSAGPASFYYDNEGQLGGGYGSSYTFDGLHRLTGMSGANNATYSYDGSGNRLKAIRGGTTTKYVYDAAGNLLCETDGSNNVTRYYIYGAGLLAMVTPAGDVYCYHFNATGSTVALTDANQAIVKSYAYDPFGNCNEAGDANLTQPFKYVGQFGVMAESNGFYYMRARYYDPKVGRFICEDPSGFAGGDVNLSNYAGGNPVNFTDPQGLCANKADQVATSTSIISFFFEAANYRSVGQAVVGGLGFLFDNSSLLASITGEKGKSVAEATDSAGSVATVAGTTIYGAEGVVPQALAVYATLKLSYAGGTWINNTIINELWRYTPPIRTFCPDGCMRVYPILRW